MRYVTMAGGVLAMTMLTGCASSMIEPGHRGVLFDPHNGLQHEVLQPGYYRHGVCVFSSACPRVDDFDVTYSRKREDIQTQSIEGLALDLKLTIVYRPIVSELYQLDTEIGPNYYEEVIGPEFRSAARGVFARHSYLDLQKNNEKIENEIEGELRRRTANKHVEVSSVLLEHVQYAPEIVTAVRARLVGAEEAARLKAQQENEASRRKRELEIRSEQEKLAAEADARQKKLVLEQEAERRRLEMESQAESEAARIDLELKRKKAELELARQRVQVEKAEAEAKVAAARGDAGARMALAKAHEAENQAEAATVTPMHVMIHAYDALGRLGGTGTMIMLGDWSKVPSFLFPRSFGNFQIPWMPMAPPQVPAPTAAAPVGNDDVYSSTAKPGARR
jgi:regulator of protease activity HflC (stomatin/prohibitin superfamily)